MQQMVIPEARLNGTFHHTVGENLEKDIMLKKKKKDSDKKLFFESVNFFVKILWSKQTLRISVKNL